MRPEKLTTKAQEALRAAIDQAQRNGHPELYPEQILRELLVQDGGIVAPVVSNAGAGWNSYLLIGN